MTSLHRRWDLSSLTRCGAGTLALEAQTLFTTGWPGKSQIDFLKWLKYKHLWVEKHFGATKKTEWICVFSTCCFLMNFYLTLSPFKFSVRLLRIALVLFTLPETRRPQAASRSLSSHSALLPPDELVSTCEIPGKGWEERCQQTSHHSVPGSSQQAAGRFCLL